MRREKKFTEIRKGGDYVALGNRLGVDPFVARIIRNRDVAEEDMEMYLRGTLGDLLNPHLLKDAELAARIIQSKIEEKKHIRVIGDYDIDGVMSSYILVQGLRNLGADVSVQIPHRISDGYGLNRNLIEEAHADAVDTIITCDNGISAAAEIALAKEYGMTVVVTDHHQVTNGIPAADAVVNPHQPGCGYPFKDICGATVAWKVLSVVYEFCGHSVDEVNAFIENVAFATVGDIMPLQGENRILVREGLRAVMHSSNIGMRALIAQCGLQDKQIQCYHFGFVLGPCINATGRLDTASRALSLFLTTEEDTALQIASELVTLNEERKLLTEQGIELAKQEYEAGDYEDSPVIVLYLPTVHESIAGIIAGRIREAYYKPTFILTQGETHLKGSARSIDGYSLADEMTRCKDLFVQFGGHPKAAGLSLEEANLERFRKTINDLCPMRVEDMVEKVAIDACPPMSYLTVDFVEQLAALEPFGNGNASPLFGARNVSLCRYSIIGKAANTVKLLLADETGNTIDGILFGEADSFVEFLKEQYSAKEQNNALYGRKNNIRMNLIYSPKINDFRGKNVQMEIKYYF